MPTQFLPQSVYHSDREASKGMQGCIKRMWRRGVSACVVATGKGDVGRSLLQVDAGCKRVLVPPPGIVS